MVLFNVIKQTKVSKEQSFYPSKPCVFYLEGRGINCSSVVKKDDQVEVGQVLGEEKDDLSIPLISSINGRVLEVKDTYNTLGKKVKAIVVEPAKAERNENKEFDVKSSSFEEILNAIQSYGLCDENGVPLSIKYRAFEGKKLLIKSFSYEPNLVAYEILKTKEKEISKALEVLNKIFPSLEVKTADDKNVSKRTVELKRGELVEKFFGSKVKDEDVIIEDLHTIIYLGECFLTGRPHLEEYVVVSGGAISENILLKARIGTSLREIFEGLSGNKELLAKTVVGGAFNGITQFSIDSSVSNNTKAILFLSKREVHRSQESPCIRCAKCLRICPEGLNPIKLRDLWERGEKEEFLKFGGMRCIECGLCSYVCPSKIELASKITTAKAFIK